MKIDPKISLCRSHFWKVVYLALEFWVDSYFPQICEDVKILFHCLLASAVADEKPTNSVFVVPKINYIYIYTHTDYIYTYTDMVLNDNHLILRTTDTLSVGYIYICIYIYFWLFFLDVLHFFLLLMFFMVKVEFLYIYLTKNSSFIKLETRIFFQY